MPGARRHPQPRVRKIKAHEQVTTGSPNDPAFPARVVLTVSSVLSPVSGLVVTVTGAMRKHRRRLDASVAASGPHGFAVRVDALRPAHRKRPSRPAPNVRDDRDTPLLVGARRAKKNH